MSKKNLVERLPRELPTVMASRKEYAELAIALGKAPFFKYLVMENGTRVGWRSNRHVYVSPVAYKVATGKYPKGYSGKAGELGKLLDI